MKCCSKVTTSEKIQTRKFNAFALPRNTVKCPIDKWYLESKSINSELIESHKNVSKTIALHNKLKKCQEWKKIYFLNRCAVYSFAGVNVCVIYFIYQCSYQIQLNPNLSSYPFLIFLIQLVTMERYLRTMKIEVHVDIKSYPRIFINHAMLLRKQNLKKYADTKTSTGSLYGGTILVYDNFGRNETRVENSTRVEIEYNNKAAGYPVDEFSQFKTLLKNKNVFSNVLMPKSYTFVEPTELEGIALRLFYKSLKRNKGNRALAFKKAFRRSDKDLKDAMQRYFKKKINGFVDLNRIFRRNLKIYFDSTMSPEELAFYSLHSELICKKA